MSQSCIASSTSLQPDPGVEPREPPGVKAELAEVALSDVPERVVHAGGRGVERIHHLLPGQGHEFLAPGAADGEKLLHVASVGRLGRQALQRPANRVRVKIAPRRQDGRRRDAPASRGRTCPPPSARPKNFANTPRGARFPISPKRLERDILPGSRGRTSVSRNRDLSLKEKSPSHEWGEDSSIAKPGAAGKGRKLAMRGRVLLGYAPRVREA